MEEENYIDDLFKDAFHSYEIQPKKPLDVNNALESAKKATGKTGIKTILFNKIIFSVVSGAILIIVATTVAYIIYNNKNTLPLNQEYTPTVPQPIHDESTPINNPSKEQLNETDSVEHLPIKQNSSIPQIKSPQKALPKKEEKLDSISNQPVIMHETVIKRDTIVKHKKIIRKSGE